MSAPALTPTIAVPQAPQLCGACGGTTLLLLCEARQLAEQLEQAQSFHAARLVRGDPAEREERSSFTQSEPARIVACRDCGLLSRDPMPSAESLVQRYEDDAYPEARLDEMLAAQVALFRRKLPWLRRQLGIPRRVLEVGSFVGGFLDVARTAGWPAIGIDPGRQVSEFCRSRGLDVRTCTLEEFEPSSDLVPFDCIAIWNTFDQLVDPKPALAFAQRWLGPGGLLALRVPHGAHFARIAPRMRSAASAASRAARRFTETWLAWNNLLGFPYLHGYGLDSLDHTIRPFGFERVAVQGDVLGLLAGRATADWARREEHAAKQLGRVWIRLDARRPQSRLVAAPWLDVCYRRSESSGS